MPTDVAVSCGGLPAGAVPADFVKPRHLALGLAPPAANVRLRATAVHSVFPEDLSPELLDLLEVAASVYAADQSAPGATGRTPWATGGGGASASGCRSGSPTCGTPAGSASPSRRPSPT